MDLPLHHRGIGVNLPSRHSRTSNVVCPEEEPDPALTDTVANKPNFNRKTDSEVLIGIPLFNELDDTISEEDEIEVHNHDDHDVEAGTGKPESSSFWSKRVEGRERKGFDSKAKKAAIPTAASMDRMDRERHSKMSTRGSELMKDKGYVRRQIWTMLSPSDNRLSMKLFGSRKGIQKEQQRLKEAGNLIIHPCSKFRFYWDLVMLFLILFNVVCLPVVITYFKHEDLSTSWIVFNCIMDTLFMLDVAFNFRTGFMDVKSSIVILNPSVIANHYVKTWFFVDLLSSVPMDYVFLMFDTGTSDDGDTSVLYEVSRALRILRFAKLLSLVRLLRLSRLMRFVGQYEQVFNVASAVIRISNLVSMMLLIGHWNGCLQFLVPVIQDFPPYSWVTINRLENVHWWEQYAWSLFKAMSHMLCIGYGRFPPQCTTDVWLTMVSMISGATCFALFIGHATNLIQSMDSSSRQYREKVKQVEEYMSYNKLPEKMRLKVLDYYEYRYHGKMFDEKQIFSEVSRNLHEDIANYTCRELVASVPFFTDADSSFVTRVVALLNFELYQPGDYILREGTFGDRMFFIQSGIVDVIAVGGYTQTTLSDGSYFGEICLMTKYRRTADVRACSYCCLYSLSVDNFYSILAEYPAMHKTMTEVAKIRLGRLGRGSEIGMLDTANMAKKHPFMFNLPPDVGSGVFTPGHSTHGNSTHGNSAHGSGTSSEYWHGGPILRKHPIDANDQVKRDSERLINIINIQDEQGKDRDHVFEQKKRHSISKNVNL